jgi:hypothetical protein
MRNYLIADMIDRSLDIRKCQDVIHASIDAMVTESPLIGDCSLLPYPKRTIQSAIGKLTNHYETQAELTNDPVFRTRCEEMIPRMQFLLNELTYRWHEIADEDKSAIARLKWLGFLSRLGGAVEGKVSRPRKGLTGSSRSRRRADG